MKMIDAYWEKRNLGLTTAEVLIERNDTLDQIRNSLNLLKSEYIVVRVPVKTIQTTFLLEELGFNFVETMVHSEYRMSGASLNETNHASQILIRRAGAEDIETTYSMIQKGLYTTDRISLDPFFENEIANKRYIGWLNDELSRGLELYVFTFQNKDFGFAGLKKESIGVYRNVLYGVYPLYQGKGLAPQLICKTIEMLKRREISRLLIDISSNNIPSLRCCQHCGFQIVDFTYVFIKHNLLQKHIG